MTAVVASNTPSNSGATSATSHAATMPGTTVAGELLLALLGNGSNASGQSFPAVTGWAKNVESLDQFARQFVGWAKTATGSDGSSQSFTSGNAGLWLANVLRIQDCDGIDGYNESGPTFDSTINTPSLTTTVDDCLVLHGIFMTASASDRTVTPPGSTTAVFDEQNAFQPIRMVVRSFVQATAGATGTRTWSLDGGTWLTGFAIALAPAAASGLDLDATTQALTLTAQQATVSRARAIAAAAQALTLTAQQATVSRALAIAATTPALELTAQPATVSRGRAIAAAAQALTLTAQTATVQGGGLAIAATTPALALTAFAATITFGRTITATTQALLLEAQAATVELGEAAELEQHPRGIRRVHVPALDKRKHIEAPMPRPRAPRARAPIAPRVERSADPVIIPRAAVNRAPSIDIDSYANQVIRSVETVVQRIKRRRG